MVVEDANIIELKMLRVSTEVSSPGLDWVFELSVFPRGPLAKRPHKLTLFVKDSAGRKANRTVDFDVN